jgi:RNA polymerase sigma factor (TIGR02999 family)
LAVPVYGDHDVSPDGQKIALVRPVDLEAARRRAIAPLMPEPEPDVAPFIHAQPIFGQRREFGYTVAPPAQLPMSDLSAESSGSSDPTLVERADAGDAAAKEALFASLYDELHRLAQTHVRRSGGQLTMGATTLLHEAYLALHDRKALVFPDRLRFLRYASRAMRGLIIDYVRSRHAEKRGGDLTFLTLDDAVAGPADDAPALERLGQALEELAQIDAALAELVDLKFFCGFSFVEIAGMRGVSERTVQRDWAKARVVLHDSLSAAQG